MWIDETQLSKQQRRKIEYITKDITVTKDFESAVDREVYNRDIFREKTKGKTMPKIKVKLLNKKCEPAKTHRWDAGWDLKATERTVIPEGKVVKVHTGVIIEIPARHCGLVVPRSSFGTKYRVTLANDVGVIDSEYRGELLVFLSNDGTTPVVIDQYERFAQLLIVPINSSELWIVDKLSETDRGSGGFGSTNTAKEDLTYVADEAIKYDDPGDIGEQPVNDLSEQAKKLADQIDKEIRDTVITLTPAEYTKLQASGRLKKLYPEATGDMKVDLCL